jgi:thioredoxin-like negative regulator of GroEL
LEGLLAQVRSGEERDAAREAMLKLFAVLGDDDPLVSEYRPKLAAALY